MACMLGVMVLLCKYNTLKMYKLEAADFDVYSHAGVPRLFLFLGNRSMVLAKYFAIRYFSNCQSRILRGTIKFPNDARL